MTVKRIDHIAIIVSDIEEAQAFYRDALGLEATHIERVADQDAIVAFMPAGDSEIELVEPMGDTSGVARFLGKHGPGIHHICLEVDDIEVAMADMRARGAQLINEEPTIGSGGKKIAFTHPKSTFGVLIELYQATPGESARRASTLEELSTRLNVERQAVSAGFSAFVRALRASVTGALGEDFVIGDGRGIKLKAEGEVIETDE